MSEAYLIAAGQGTVVPFSTRSYAEQIQPVIQDVLENSGLSAPRIQELHWFGGPEEFWFSELARRINLAADLSRFQWPVVSVLSHAVLHSTSRAIELGERDVVLLAQQSGDQVIALLLASPKAVGRHNLAPRARVALRLSLSRQPDGFLKGCWNGIEKSTLETKDVQRFASPGQFPVEEIQSVFPIAQRVSENGSQPRAGAPTGDLFLLDALVCSLEESDASLGLLLSPAPHGAALATLVERT